MEAFGTFASAASLALELGKAIMKVHNLWQQVQGAPRQVHDLLRDIYSLEPQLVIVKKHFERKDLPPEFWDEDAAKGCLGYCEESLRLLSDVVEALEGEISSSKGKRRKMLGVKVKIVWKQEVLTRLVEARKRAGERLQTTLALFQMAQIVAIDRRLGGMTTGINVPQVGVSGQFLGVALVEDTKARITELTDGTDDADKEVQRAPVKKPTIRWKPAKADLSPASRLAMSFGRRSLGNLSITTSKDGNYLDLRVEPPRWLATVAWEFQYRYSFQAEFRFRQYNIRQYSSTSVFSYASYGNMQELLRLFQMREASPFDRDESGRSLLYYAASYNRLRICEYLLTMGLGECLDEDDSTKSEEKDNFWGSDSVITICTEGLHGDETFLNTRRSLIHLFQKYRSAEDMSLFELKTALGNGYAPSLFGPFIQAFWPTYYEMPSRERFSMARRLIIYTRTGRNRERFRQAACRDAVITAKDIKESAREEHSLIHTAVIAYGREVSQPRHLHFTYEEELLELMKEFVALADAGDLHQVERVDLKGIEDFQGNQWYRPITCWTGTPLSSLLYSISLYSHNRVEKVPKHLRLWLEILKESGVDLVEYGLREKEIVQRRVGDDDDGLPITLASLRVTGEPSTEILYIRDFDVGPAPDDWTLHWGKQYEMVAGEFWELVERPPTSSMPGSWRE